MGEGPGRFTPFLDFPPTGAPRRASPTGAGGAPSTNAIESASDQLRKGDQEPRSLLSSDEAAVELLWLAICNIEDKRARERDKDQGKPASKRTAPPRLIQGQLTTNWKQALAQLTTAYPDRITPYL